MCQADLWCNAQAHLARSFSIARASSTLSPTVSLIPTLPVVFQAVSGQQANHRISSTDVPRSIGGPRE